VNIYKFNIYKYKNTIKYVYESTATFKNISALIIIWKGIAMINILIHVAISIMNSSLQLDKPVLHYNK